MPTIYTLPKKTYWPYLNRALEVSAVERGMTCLARFSEGNAYFSLQEGGQEKAKLWPREYYRGGNIIKGDTQRPDEHPIRQLEIYPRVQVDPREMDKEQKEVVAFLQTLILV